MNTRQHLDLLLTELAEKSISVNEVKSGSEDKWELTCLERQLVVRAQYSESESTLTLSCTLPSPTTDEPESMFETLLYFNLDAGENDGVVLGLNKDGAVVQTMQVPTFDLAVKTVKSRVEFFLVRAVFATGAINRSEELESPSEPLMLNPSMFV